MQEFSDNRRREILERSRATLTRLQDAERRRQFEDQQRQYTSEGVDNINKLPVYVAETRWDPANPRRLTVATMSQREFNAWCAAGRPPLVAPVATVTKAKADNMVRAAIDQERANLQSSLQTLAEIIGDETGKADAKLAEQIEQLRAELDALRAEQRGAVLDLPLDWRSHVSH